jgi:thiol-disulfide isomerase/thioredoxin
MSKAVVWAMVLMLALAGCQRPDLTAEPQPAAGATAPAELAPDFTLATLDGATVQLSTLRGRWVLVNFWATWCAPCREEMPYLDSLAAQHADRLTVLAVNMRESEDAVAAFVAELDLRLPVLLAPDDATLLAYNVRGLPISFLIDPDGAVVQRMVGPVTPGRVETEIDEQP